MAEQVIADFILGFVEKDSSRIARSIAKSFVMFGGSSDNPLELEAHMFLKDESIAEWIQGMLDEAGPHENSYEIVHQSERMGAKVIVTRETGKNRFRVWEDQLTTYILGDYDGAWKIVAYYLNT